jgi:hypothetical protein
MGTEAGLFKKMWTLGDHFGCGKGGIYSGARAIVVITARIIGKLENS